MATRKNDIKIRLSAKREAGDGARFVVTAEIDSAFPVLERKWSSGKRDLSFFADDGTNFDNFFVVGSTGVYTVYAKSEDGAEAAETIKIHEKKWLKKWVVIAVICILAIAAALAVGGYISSRGNDRQPPSSSQSRPSKLNDSGDGSAIDGNYHGKSQAETLSELEKEQVNVTESLSSSITFPSGNKGSKGNWMLNNASSNTVIMQAEIEMNGRSIAKSAAVQPGQHIDSIILNQNVPTGTNKVIAYINYYNLQTQEYMGKAGYQITLVVQ